MKNVLVVGSGAREVAIARCISQSSIKNSLFCVSKDINPQIFDLCKDYFVTDLANISDIVSYCRKNKVDFAIIGPENPLANGIVNELENVGVGCVGPKKEVALIETSKTFARKIIDLCCPEKNPQRKEFSSIEGVESFIKQLSGEYVIKFDGLMGGKGVRVSGEHLKNIDEGVAYANEIINIGGKFLIEEKLVGEEFSLMSFVDGKVCKHMPVVQDHKRAYEGDTGPNTGGMGTYSFGNHSLPFLSEKDINEAQKTNELVAKQLFEETGTPYVGILYGGFMLTRGGVKVIEYNARFGDPEAMNILSILESDFLSICISMVDGNLKNQDVSFEKLATVCKYVVPVGYPEKPTKNFEVFCDQNDRSVFLASVMLKDQKLIACGSRTVAVVGKNKDVFQAELFAETGIANISGNLFHRKDIGTKKLIDSRIKRMKKLLQ
jgi:phosphoribosylamine--glycine ligase|tara:strand:- start:296 stop:1603 length:1308 start_codon:yes stop_codon:yes gene_type:complete